MGSEHRSPTRETLEMVASDIESHDRVTSVKTVRYANDEMAMYAGTKVSLSPTDYHYRVVLDIENVEGASGYSHRFGIDSLHSFVDGVISEFDNRLEVRGYRTDDDYERVTVFLRMGGNNDDTVQRLRRLFKQHDGVLGAYGGSEVAFRISHWHSEPDEYDVLIVGNEAKQRRKSTISEDDFSITAPLWNEEEIKKLATAIIDSVVETAEITGVGVMDGNNLQKYPVFAVTHGDE